MNRILSEKEYQAFILEYLSKNNGYIIRKDSNFDRLTGMDKELLFQFLDATQPKEMAELSYNLAKIKTDIEIDITLDDLKYCIDKENAKNILLNYEIKSRSI